MNNDLFAGSVEPDENFEDFSLFFNTTPFTRPTEVSADEKNDSRSQATKIERLSRRVTQLEGQNEVIVQQVVKLYRWVNKPKKTNTTGKKKCAAINKNGFPCASYPVKGEDLCPMHSRCEKKGNTVYRLASLNVVGEVGE
jgi:hypothetical protein